MDRKREEEYLKMLGCFFVGAFAIVFLFGVGVGALIGGLCP